MTFSKEKKLFLTTLSQYKDLERWYSRSTNHFCYNYSLHNLSIQVENAFQNRHQQYVQMIMSDNHHMTSLGFLKHKGCAKILETGTDFRVSETTYIFVTLCQSDVI